MADKKQSATKAEDTTKAKASNAGTADVAEAVASEVIEPEVIDTDDEEAMAEAAKRAGEAAANADFKAEAGDLRSERDELTEKLSAAADEIEAAKTEAASATEKLSRLQADWENYRRRVDRERIAERERACEGLIKDLLPAIDDLERAIAHAGSAAEGNDAVQQLVDGVSAVHTKVISVLEKQGASVIDPAGEAFDPNDHQAVGRVENTEVFDETVNDVYQKGYRLGSKVIRPAMVTVTYGGAKRRVEDATEDKQD